MTLNYFDELVMCDFLIVISIYYFWSVLATLNFCVTTEGRKCEGEKMVEENQGVAAPPSCQRCDVSALCRS